MKAKRSTEKEESNILILDNCHDLELLTRRQVTSLLKIGISSLDKISEIELPRVRIGRSVRFTKTALTEYIKTKEKGVKNEQK